MSGGEDVLLESLRFKLPNSASYIQERRLVSWHPTGASTFSPTGVRQARFNITSSGWLDPASLRINLRLRNLSDGGAILRDSQETQVHSSPECALKLAVLL